MTQNTGYQITEKDIESAIRFLKAEGKSNSPEDAIKYLEEKHAIAHMAAHKIVDDEQSGKIKKVVPKDWGGSPKELVNTIVDGFKQLEDDLKDNPKS